MPWNIRLLWNTLINFLKLPWNTFWTLWEHPWNFQNYPWSVFDILLKPPWNLLERALKLPRITLWNTVKTPFKFPYNTLETSLQTPTNTLKTSFRSFLKHHRNTLNISLNLLEIYLKHPLVLIETLETPLKYPWKYKMYIPEIVTVYYYLYCNKNRNFCHSNVKKCRDFQLFTCISFGNVHLLCNRKFW